MEVEERFCAIVMSIGMKYIMKEANRSVHRKELDQFRDDKIITIELTYWTLCELSN